MNNLYAAIFAQNGQRNYDKFDFMIMLMILMGFLFLSIVFTKSLKKLKNDWNKSGDIKKIIGVFFAMIAFFIFTAYITKILIFDLNLFN